jgi:hypothetical protein
MRPADPEDRPGVSEVEKNPVMPSQSEDYGTSPNERQTPPRAREGDGLEAGRQASQHPVASAGTGEDTTTKGDPGLIRDIDRFRGTWQSVQVGFVEDPRRALDEAAALVEHVIEELSAVLRRETDRLTGEWDQSGETKPCARRLPVTATSSIACSALASIRISGRGRTRTPLAAA